MGVLTETELRRALLDKKVASWTIPAGTTATPAALDFLKEHGIGIVWEAAPKAVLDASF